MKIAILDDSKTFLHYLEFLLNSLGFNDIRTFHNENDFEVYVKKNANLDLVFIDYHLKDKIGFDVLAQTQEYLLDAYKIMITSDSDPSLKQEALKRGFDIFISKQISKYDLHALLNMIKKLRVYVRKEIEKREKFKKILNYKEYQEKIIHQKQNKIMKNELEMFFDENYLFETYFAPKDLLTGDTIYTKKFSNNSYFIGIIDAMGKGLGASITSFNALAFLKHSIKKAIEYNDFNFEKLTYDFVNYAKSILLENEILCASLVFINNNKLHYANFGNPPFLSTSGIIGTNNHPIRIATMDININTIQMQNKLLISSDGIFESPYKDGIYFKRLKQIFPQITFLKEIIDDFNVNSSQTDDTSIMFITKEADNFQLIFEDELTLNKCSIDKFLQKLFIQNIPNIGQIHLILHEILTNTYEHAILKIENKEKMKKEKKILENFDKNSKFFAKIKLSKNEKCLKIEYEDNTKGFDVQTIKDAYYKKYHGRGIKIIKHLACGLFFNEKGTSIKIFLKVKP